MRFVSSCLFVGLTALFGCASAGPQAAPGASEPVAPADASQPSAGEPQCAAAPSCGPSRETFSELGKCESGGHRCTSTEMCGRAAFCRDDAGQPVAPPAPGDEARPPS